MRMLQALVKCLQLHTFKHILALPHNFLYFHLFIGEYWGACNLKHWICYRTTEGITGAAEAFHIVLDPVFQLSYILGLLVGSTSLLLVTMQVSVDSWRKLGLESRLVNRILSGSSKSSSWTGYHGKRLWLRLADSHQGWAHLICWVGSYRRIDLSRWLSGRIQKRHISFDALKRFFWIPVLEFLLVLLIDLAEPIFAIIEIGLIVALNRFLEIIRAIDYTFHSIWFPRVPEAIIGEQATHLKISFWDGTLALSNIYFFLQFYLP